MLLTHSGSAALLPCLSCFTRFLGTILVLGDLDSFLPLVVRVIGNVLDQSVDQCVLVQSL